MKITHLTAIALGMQCCSFSFLSAQQINTQRIDSLLKLSNKVYSIAQSPAWTEKESVIQFTVNSPQGQLFHVLDIEANSRQTFSDKKALEKYLFDNDLTKDSQAVSKKNGNKELEKSDSPDRRFSAFIRDNNIFIQKITDEKTIQLTHDGSPGTPYAGKIQWSPDSKKIIAYKVLEVQNRKIPLIESAPKNQLQPVIHWRDYNKPGDALPVKLLKLYDVETLTNIPIDMSAYLNQFNLYFTGWRKDSRAFSFEFNERGHQRYIVGEVDAVIGEVRNLIEETSPTFISYINNFRYDLNDGSEVLWLSERDGWRHLYLIDGTNGQVRKQLTKGDWVVRRIEHVDEVGRKVYFMASGLNKQEDPYNQHYCSVDFDGRNFKDLTPENGNHTIEVSVNRTYFTDRYSRPDLPQVSQVRKFADSKFCLKIDEANIDSLLASGWTKPEVFKAKGRDNETDIWGVIYRPFNFDPSKSYPVIEDIYAGPHGSFVQKDFGRPFESITALTNLGFIVVKIDGMGTNNRSKKFHDVCWKNLKDAGFPDRIKWIKEAAAKYPYMDISRVGVYGWSAGGQNAMSALLHYNDFYKAAVAFCGCHDNRMDKVWWNELWMGYPVDTSYLASSNVENAHLLKGDLLLINGELDDNVDPTSTLQVVDALVKADKYFEQLYLPGKGHSLGGKYELNRLYDFFIRHLNPDSSLRE